MLQLTVSRESWKIKGTFRISRGARTSAEVVLVSLVADGATGVGECVPYARYGESLESVCEQIDKLRPDVEAGNIDRQALQEALPPGAARNALDCALWDLEAKQNRKRVWELAGLPQPEPVTTAYTLSLDSVEAMAANAAANAERPLLKLKLAGPEDLDRVRAVREAAPQARLIVDANESWSLETYRELAPLLAELGVVMIEQPLHAEEDGQLRGEPRPVPLCADESCHDRSTLPALAERYDMVNIKLDKTGGLTEALALKAEAEKLGIGIMVGCMLGTSLAMAPALLVAQGAAIVDLDGPLLLAEDRQPALTFKQSLVHPPKPALWG
jgi:L-alanine-DL-glutamate epimerase-like enolase superfamily enzyme